MRKGHPFIFGDGVWLGEGDIAFSVMPGQTLKYHMRWNFSEEGETMSSLQEIEIDGGAESVRNTIVFKKGNGDFTVSLENAALGTISGAGVVDETSVAWEFRNDPSRVEGYEAYVLQGDGSYIMKAEYISPDKVSTTIKGKIWKKSEG